MSFTVLFRHSSKGSLFAPGVCGSDMAKNFSRSSNELSLSGRWDEASTRGEEGPAGLLSASLSREPEWSVGIEGVEGGPSRGLGAALGSEGESMQ